MAQKTARKIIPKMFKPGEPISQYFFAQLANVSQAAISKAVEKGRVITDENNLVPCDNLKNSLFLIKHITTSLNAGTDEEKRYRQAVLRVLTTHSNVNLDAPEPQLYNYDKLPHEQTFKIGIVEDSEFIPIVSLTKFESKSDEIQIRPLSAEITIGLEKGKLTHLYVGELTAGDLYYIPAN